MGSAGALQVLAISVITGCGAGSDDGPSRSSDPAPTSRAAERRVEPPVEPPAEPPAEPAPAPWQGPDDGCYWRWLSGDDGRRTLEAVCATPGVWRSEAHDGEHGVLRACTGTGAVGFPDHCHELLLSVPAQSECRTLGFQAGTPMHMLGARVVSLEVCTPPEGAPTFRWVGRGYRVSPRAPVPMEAPDPPDAPPAP